MAYTNIRPRSTYKIDTHIGRPPLPVAAVVLFSGDVWGRVVILVASLFFLVVLRLVRLFKVAHPFLFLCPGHVLCLKLF